VNRAATRPETSQGRRADDADGVPGPSLRFLGRFESPVTCYYVLFGASTILVVFGLVMVMSASMVISLTNDGSSFAIFFNQLGFAVVGLVGAGVASRIPVRWYRRLAFPALGFAVVLQVLVFTSLGVTVNGNRNWLRLLPRVQLQPSELMKLGVVLVGAAVLANKRRLLGTGRHIIFPFVVPVVVLAVGLVVKGGDLGTTLVLLGIAAAVLFVAGIPLRYFIGAGLAAGLFAAVMAVTSSNRMGRISGWLSGTCTSPDGPCGQSVHGLYALADGGWWGVGLGASIEKWHWLPEAQNDFIFAIIGEELGLPGTLTILALFCLLGWACYRLVVSSREQFVRIATAGVMAWVLMQAMVNIGAVIGLLPVIGVPLPLVSTGGSALVTTMLALGMLLSFARNEPGAKRILAERPSLVSRSIAVLPRRRNRA